MKYMRFVWNGIFFFMLFWQVGRTQEKAEEGVPIEEVHEEEQGEFPMYDDTKKAFFDVQAFDGAIYIKLYEVKKGKLWAPPLKDTSLKTSNFGMRWKAFHHGVDLALKMRDPVFCVFDGIVKVSTYGNGYGNFVIVKHENGLETLYAHLSGRVVKVGQQLKAGELVGLGGSTGFSTGPHLHFEVRYQGYSINPLYVYDFANKKQIRADHLVLTGRHFRHLGNGHQEIKSYYYQANQDDSLENISHQYKISLATLQKLNGVNDGTMPLTKRLIRLK